MKNLKDFYGIILAGGSGTRLWPLSRELNPKQLLTLFGTESLISQTVKRLLPLIDEERIFIVAGKTIASEIRTHLRNRKKPFKKVKFIIEPLPKNTAPAIALAALYLKRRNPDAIISIFPSDHYTEGEEGFRETLAHAYQLAKKGYLVTLGIKPTRAETGYGYIKAGKNLPEINFPAYKVERFIEKPELAVAQKLIKDKSYFWNSGIFFFKAKVILREIESFMPQLSVILKEIEKKEDWTDEETISLFEGLEPISIDYGVMEKSQNVAVIPASFKWNDVGTLLAIEEFNEKDEKGNVIAGNVVDVDSEDSLIYAEDRLIATIGLKNMAVIDTYDATLICPKDKVQEVRKVVEILKERKADEFFSPRTVERPWGSYTLLGKGPGYKLKMVEVKPGGKLSHQLHHHRSEHWIIISGTAKITRGDEVFHLHPNESTFIPFSTPHRLENPGLIPLKLIEVQIGELLEERDIVRFKDIYGRDEEF
jgi:mannose-1-phosphate guanylyltransferase/mannose-6-phosphate isomerase